MDQRGGDGRFSGRIKKKKKTQEEGQPQGAESPKRGVLHCADLFSITLRNDNVQEFDTRWDEILLCMTKIPSDDIVENLHQLRKRESEKLKTAFELCDMEIHQKISMLECQKLKTMVKRSMDQKLRSRNSDARHGTIESGAVVKSRKGFLGVEGRRKRYLPVDRKGQCSKGDTCSFRHESECISPPSVSHLRQAGLVASHSISCVSRTQSAQGADKMEKEHQW